MQVKSRASLVIQHGVLVRFGVFMPPVVKQRWRTLCSLGVGVWLSAAPAMAAPTAAAASEPANGDAPRRALVEQKLRLVEQLLGSARVLEVGAGSDLEAKAALTRARALLAESLQAASSSASTHVEPKLNEALRLVVAATRSRAGGQAAEDGQAQRNTELRDQINAYRRAIVAALEARRIEPQPAALAALDQFIADAERLAASGRHGEANKALTQAYRVAGESLSALRAGETVTIALKFDTPADEYAYEQKRHQSHEMLVEMTVAERRPSGAALASIEQQVREARALRERATESVAAGDHPTAIRLLEEGTGHLVRALQAAGMPGVL